MTHEETTQFTVLELWPGIYVKEIGNEFDWECKVHFTDDISALDDDDKPESFAVTNDPQKAKKLLEEYGEGLWKTALLSSFPNAKLKTITITTKTTIEGETHGTK